MNWIIASLLMFVSSVVLYLCVRKSNALKTPRQLNNLAMFLIPLLIYILLAISASTSFKLTLLEYLIILAQGIFFSYLGNTFSLKSIEYAPNPGYSLIISKSYVVFTTIASIFIFSAPISTMTLVAIALIIIFSTLITFDQSKNRTASNKLWLPYAMGAFFCSGLLALSSKYLHNIGVPVLTRLIISMTAVTAIILGEIKYKKIAWKKTSKNQLITLVLIGKFCLFYANRLQPRSQRRLHQRYQHRLNFFTNPNVSSHLQRRVITKKDGWNIRSNCWVVTFIPLA